jgi:adenylate cyclase
LILELSRQQFDNTRGSSSPANGVATILIVEDRPADIRRLKKLLESEGYVVLVQKDPNLAVDTIRARNVDLVFLDVMFDDKVRFDVCQALHAVPGNEDLPVIFISKLDAGSDKAKGFDFGAADYITKDSEAAEVIARVKTQLTKRFLQQKLQRQNEEMRGLRELVRQFFSPELFALMEKGSPMLDMQRREITVVFWDIRGFSRLCDVLQASPELIVLFLREYCELAAHTINEHGGILDKFMGDGTMALFGTWATPERQVDAARDAARCALLLQHRFAKLREEWLIRWKKKVAQDIPQIELGCGIGYGQVFVGRVGTTFRDQFTAVGPDVNLCSRIENKAGKDGVPLILVVQQVEAMLRDDMFFHPATVISDFRNISGSYTLYALDGERPRAVQQVPPASSLN